MGRLNNRRDLVFVDQRGTGRSAPLRCESDDHSVCGRWPSSSTRSVQMAQLASCRERLMRLPHGDLRRYTTSIAMADVESVRSALGAPTINLVGASYGTRAALEYMRQFPRAVRRVVLDGVAPADMVLPASFSADNQAALDGLFDWCAADADCNGPSSAIARVVAGVLDGLPRAGAGDQPADRSGRVGAADARRGARHGALAAVRAGTGGRAAGGDRRRRSAGASRRWRGWRRRCRAPARACTPACIFRWSAPKTCRA